MDYSSLPIRIPVILIALTIHEYAHGYVAWIKGDPTAKNAGRLSLNPLAHLDLFGTLMLLYGPFGWAKPVPVNHMNLTNPRKDAMAVGAAGPIANIILALISGVLFRFISTQGLPFASTFIGGYSIQFLQLSFIVNVGLSFFNLLPIPPLDGSHILFGLLPHDKLQGFIRVQRYAPPILFGLLLIEWVLHIPVFSYLINPLWKPYFSLWHFVVFGK